jgi:hypothetical protein
MVKNQNKGDERGAPSPLLLPEIPSESEALAIPSTSTLPASTLNRWNTYIESRVGASSKEEALARETAENYKRYARLWWEKVIQPTESLEDVSEDTLLARTDAYFKEIEKKNSRTCRANRSLIVGSFLPWCIKENLCLLSQNSLLCLSPLAWHQYHSPLVDRFLDDSSPLISLLSLNREDARSLFRTLHYWIATRHLGYNGAAIKVDARPILQSELDFLQTKSHLGSPSSWMFSDTADLTTFIDSRRSPFPHRNANELFSSFISWGGTLLPLSQDKDKDLSSSDTQDTQPLRAYAPKLPTPPLLDKISERRGRISTPLKESLPLRDILIDHLIQNRSLSLSDITLLHSPPSVESPLQSALEQYSAARNEGLLELHLNPESQHIPFFVSADGGSLVVTEEPVPIKKTLSPEAILHEALNLITHLIRTELLSFEELRRMTLAELRELPFSDSRSRKLVASYARQLQVSSLRFFSISQDGPGWAFPAVDGDALTADE